jgi:hypothetical protein
MSGAALQTFLDRDRKLTAAALRDLGLLRTKQGCSRG